MSLTHLGPDGIAATLYRSDRVGRRVASPGKITAADVERYHTEGYIAVEGVFSAEEVEAAKAGISRLVREGHPEVVTFEAGHEPTADMPLEEREGLVRRLWKFCERDAALEWMSRQGTFRSIIERLVGTQVRLIQDMALLKPPKVGREKPWHQDNAYFHYKPLHLVIGTWVALDEATVENGCMHVIPGSHLAGPRAHYHDRDCQLPDEVIEVEKDEVVPLKPGGVMFFNALVHHGTPPNRSEKRRRALQFHYASTECVEMTADEHGALFRDGAGAAHCNTGLHGGAYRGIGTRVEG